MKYLVVILISLCEVWAQAAPAHIAVSDIYLDSAIKDLEVVALAERLSSELSTTKKFRVLERREIGSILSEQGFQQSGACDESQCQVEMGRLLGVESMVTGSVARSGNAYSISIRMISVTTGELQTSVSIDVYGGSEKVMGTYLNHIAMKLADSSYVIPESKPSRLWLWISSATVTVLGGIWAIWYFNEAPPRKVSRKPELVSLLGGEQ